MKSSPGRIPSPAGGFTMAAKEKFATAQTVNSRSQPAPGQLIIKDRIRRRDVPEREDLLSARAGWRARPTWLTTTFPDAPRRAGQRPPAFPRREHVGKETDLLRATTAPPPSLSGEGTGPTRQPHPRQHHAGALHGLEGSRHPTSEAVEHRHHRPPWYRPLPRLTMSTLPTAVRLHLPFGGSSPSCCSPR